MSVPDPQDLFSAATDYMNRGWRVIPLHKPADTPSGCSCYNSERRPSCNSVGKHPVDARWQASPPMSGPDLYAHFAEDGRNVGIATGAASGFWVLDIDLDKPGTRDRLLAMQDGRKLPATFIVQTGGGGFQYYFAMPDFNVTNSAKRLPDGVDVRGTGGQVVAPPSVSGKGAYRVFADLPIAAAPDWLLDLVRPLPAASPVDLETLPKITDLPATEQRRLQAYTDRIVKAEVGRLTTCTQQGWGGPGWNQTTFEVACTLVEIANSPWSPLTLTEAHDIVLAEAPQDNGFGIPEVEGCFTSALKTVDGRGRALPENRTPEVTVYEGDPLTDPTAGAVATEAAGPDGEAGATLRDWSDLGNARRLVDQYGHSLRYIPEAKEWAVYVDGVWRLQPGAGMTKAQEMIEALIAREGHLYDDEPTGENGDGPSMREKFFKWAKSQQMSARIDACVRQATGRPELQASMVDFDQQSMLFNVANGVIDMATGELLPHDPKHLMMLQSPIAYHPAAECPRFHQFLERCLPDPDIRDYLQKATGYSLTGSMAEQAMFLHHGPGANGKSVFLVIASMLAGEYAQVVPRETLLAKGSTPEHPTSVARMRGRRFLQASETGVGRRLDEETVKGLTGGEQQTARFMGANFFDFTPTGKIHLVTNHLPRLTDAESIWRRLHLIAWTQTIPVAERDPRMLQPSYWTDEIKEAEGILAWAVAGAVMWHQAAKSGGGVGLDIPASMKRDLQEYRTDQDILGEFVSSRIEVDPDGFASTASIYEAYTGWCYKNGIRNIMTAQDLGRAMKERGLTPHRTPRARGFRARVLPLMHDVDTAEHDPLVAR